MRTSALEAPLNLHCEAKQALNLNLRQADALAELIESGPRSLLRDLRREITVIAEPLFLAMVPAQRDEPGFWRRAKALAKSFDEGAWLLVADEVSNLFDRAA